MNPKEIFTITRFFKIKSYKYTKIEEAYPKVANFLQAHVCEFLRIDAEIYSVLAEKMNFPLFEILEYIIEGFKK